MPQTSPMNWFLISQTMLVLSNILATNQLVSKWKNNKQKEMMSMKNMEWMW